MSEQETESRVYEVELSVDARAWVEVEAGDADEAHDQAKAAFYEQNSTGDLEVDALHIESVSEMKR